ncbi:MAG: sigma-54 dependent transcriptional regulator [Bacteroidota bacterium]|nr:sigma-54 dependent transcriptional regulator [Bacteroidota bacterium]MDP4193005.1 sigma-54 dependent transcriptional regulator [Bacteroidota bacterium]MDP4196123.1 sigma-54 dependent transcriptional regulator [Bacteroidota bacterium]
MKAAIYPSNPVLLVDDEEQFLLSAGLAITAHGINNVITCSDSRKVMGLLDEHEISLIVLDINMPHISGLELLPKIIEKSPEIPVVIVTALNDVDSAVKCMKMGAFDYILKPVDDTRLATTIRRGLDIRDMRQENKILKEYLLKDELKFPEAFSSIITYSNSMHSIFKYIEAIARTPLPILITGETGSGKEQIAGAIHKVSGRKGDLVRVNVAGVDDTFFSDTLFGHRKGAYTGADRERKGLIEQASEGTIFLDEIGDLSIESQVKLLRLLQDGSYYPLGSDLPKLSDARIVVATHRDIESMVKDSSFRKDLYFRLISHHIHIPPLRERKEDIRPLTDYFLDKASQELYKKRPTPPKELYDLLKIYDFPGNVRELEGMVYDAVSIHESGILSMEVFKNRIGTRSLSLFEESSESRSSEEAISFGENLPTLKEAEELLISEALKRANGNQGIAAQILGLTRTALNNRLQRSRK